MLIIPSNIMVIYININKIFNIISKNNYIIRYNKDFIEFYFKILIVIMF
jgi:hypothetical protein